ncbi:autotransporter outer membrane beta-barrel domain-containing protein [Salinarimonas rosea]|uniref:autotransporter outer membrane beta-barrel domain-containing protein n=1 Tax=Salinarimonas rosea TaxID=552063 RepID=UPI00040CFD66|nr:autotransporter domain-containing protein [Salinarimonas rosea]
MCLPGTALSGSFASVGGTGFAFLTPELVYDRRARAVDLRFARNRTPFAAFARTPNEGAMAGVIEALGPGNPLYDLLAALPSAGVQPAFDLLSGEIHAAAPGTFAEAGQALRRVLDERFGRFGTMAADAGDPAAAYASLAPDGGVGAHAIGAWARVYGSTAEIAARGTLAGLERRGGGIAMGFDGALSDAWRVGVLVGFGRTDVEMDARASRGEIGSVDLGLYGTGALGSLIVRAGAIHSWHDVSMRRTVAILGVSDSLRASYDARSWQVFGEAALPVELGAMRLEPYAGIAHLQTRSPAFGETGGITALTVAGRTTGTTFTTLGLRGRTTFDVAGARLGLSAGLGWRHAFDDAASGTAAFAGSGSFGVGAAPGAEDVAVLEAGLDLVLSERVGIALDYDGLVGDGDREHQASATLRVAF